LGNFLERLLSKYLEGELMPKVVIHRDKNRKKDGPQDRYSDKQKYNAVALYKITGNMSAVARSLGFPLDTLYVWKQSVWWKQYEDDLLQEKKALTSATLQKLVKTASEITHDRLENGDWAVIGGKLQRKPVSALHANKILQESIKSDVTLEEHYLKNTKAESDIQINERLKLLFDEMTRFAKSKEIRVAPEGGDPKPALAGELEKPNE
jgi:transposase-like protein